MVRLVEGNSKTRNLFSVFLFILFFSAVFMIFGGQASVAFADDDAAKIDEITYPTLQEAVDEAVDGDVIELLRDVSENVTVGDAADDRSLTIDLKDHTIRPENPKRMIIFVSGGESFTITNGKVTGYDPSNYNEDTLEHNHGAVHILSKKATIKDVEFNGNRGTALSAHYAVLMIDGRHFEKREIDVESCKFYYNGRVDGDFTYGAVDIHGFAATKINDCDFYGNNVGLMLSSQSPDEESDVQVKYDIRRCLFRNNTSQAIDAGVPGRGTLQIASSRISNNAVDGARDSIVDIHCVDSAGREGGNALLDYCYIHNNSGAKYTVSANVPNVVQLRGACIYDNTAEIAGGFHADAGTRLYMEYMASINNNTATGSDERSSGGVVLRSTNTVTYDGPAGEGSDGPSYDSKYAELQIRKGAIYGNKTTGSRYPENDLYVGKGCFVIAPNPEDQNFKNYRDQEKEFKGYKWLELSSESAEEELDGLANFERWYVLSRKSASFIYIDGNSGKDEGDGTRENPVKTIARAVALAEENETNLIIVLDTITIDGKNEKSIDTGGRTLRRDPGFTDGPVISVKNGVEGVIKNSVIDGASKTLIKVEKTVLDHNGQEQKVELSVPVHATDSLVKVEKGASLVLDNGAVLQNNGVSKISVVGETLNNPLGGGVFLEGKLTIKDGAVISSNVAKTGGGIYVKGGELIMEGGSIEKNSAKVTRDYFDIVDDLLRDRGYDLQNMGQVPEDIMKKVRKSASDKYLGLLAYPYGGGVCLVEDGKMTMTGGTVSNNSSDSGGAGISVGHGNSRSIEGGRTSLTMTGGRISENISESAGGGIYVQCNTTATVTGGYIINNVARASEGVSYHAGGGIYVNGFHSGNAKNSEAKVMTTAAIAEGEELPNGTLYLMNVEFAENYAKGEGGAIAWCGSGSGGIFQTGGTVIHDNTAEGKLSFVDYDDKVIKTYADKDIDILFDDLFTRFDSKNKEFIYSILKTRAVASSIDSKMLNGMEYSWTDENDIRIDAAALDNITGGLKLKTNAKATDANVKESIAKAKVHIIGNNSLSNGGGLGVNGNVYIGRTQDVNPDEEPPENNVKGVHEDLEPESGEPAELDEPVEPGGTGELRAKGSEEVEDTDLKGDHDTGTGDDFPYILMLLILILSVGTAGFTVRKHRRS